MSDFLHELEEDIRDERIVNLWRKYGNFIITLAIGIVLGTATYTLWQYFSHKEKIKRHTTFNEAVNLYNQGKTEEAKRAFEQIDKDGGGYARLAQLYEAALSQNPVESYKQLEQVYTSDPAMGNLAKVLKTTHELGNPEAIMQVQTLTAPQNAWAPLSLELTAFAELNTGDEAKAAENFLKIMKEPGTTRNENMRTIIMLSQIDIPSFLLEKENENEAPQ